jgi:hypothetical protein
MPPLTKWKNQQHWSQVSTFNLQCWNFESTDMLHNIKGWEKKIMHIRVLTLCSWQNTQLFYVFLIPARHLAKRIWSLTSVLPSALVLSKLLVLLPSSLSKHLITVLHWHAAFTITICLIPGLFQPCYLVLILEFPMVLHFMRVTGYLLSSQPAYHLFWQYKTSVGWFSDSGQNHCRRSD